MNILEPVLGATIEEQLRKIGIVFNQHPALIFSVLITLSFLALAPRAIATPQTWKIDSRKTVIHFAAPRNARFSVKGTFTGVSGTLVFDPQSIETSKLIAHIPISTLTTDVKKRDDDLKATGYFDVDRFPTSSFKSVRIQKSGAETYSLRGKLSMHGVERSVDLKFKRPKIESHSGTSTNLFVQGHAELEPRDFALDLKNIHPDGLVKLSDKVRLDVELFATK